MDFLLDVYVFFCSIFNDLKEKRISKIQIFDIEGNEIINELKVSDDFINVNLQNYVNGIYYIKFSNQKGTFIKKFVISK